VHWVKHEDQHTKLMKPSRVFKILKMMISNLYNSHLQKQIQLIKKNQMQVRVKTTEIQHLYQVKIGVEPRCKIWNSKIDLSFFVSLC
jgi:hypothetical protein